MLVGLPRSLGMGLGTTAFLLNHGKNKTRQRIVRNALTTVLPGCGVLGRTVAGEVKILPSGYTPIGQTGYRDCYAFRQNLCLCGITATECRGKSTFFGWLMPIATWSVIINILELLDSSKHDLYSTTAA